MALLNKKLTTREKAVLYMHVFGGVDDWRELYAAAAPVPEKDALKDINVSVYASKWKCTPKVKDYIKELQRIKLAQEMTIEQRAADQARKEENEKQEDTGGSEQSDNKGKRTKTAVVDYSNPENRKQLYNEVIRDAIDDPKTRLDAAKVFEQLQKDDKQAAKDQQQQRFYIPLTCKVCPLYEKAQAKKGQK